MNIHLSLTTCLAAVLLCVGCQNAQKKNNKEGNPTPVVDLFPTSVEVNQSYVADIQAVQFVEVQPKVSGFVAKIHVDEGQLVHQGQLLFTLDPAEYDEALKEAEANLKQAEAELQMADYEAERIQRMVEKEIIAQIRLDQARTEQEVARMKVRQAKAKLQLARTHYAYTRITAPFDGYIDRIPYKVGSLVTPQSLLTTVSDVSEVFAYYKVNESEYLRYKRSLLNGERQPETDSIELVLSDGTIYPHLGRMETVEGDFERGTGSIAFRVRFPNPDLLLKHGVSGKIQMKTKRDSVYLVPHQSTFEIQDFTYVYTVDSTGVVKVQSFEPLERYHDFYVTQDFTPGTTIVFEGVQLLKDGMKITPEKRDFDAIRREIEAKRSQNESKQ